MKRLTTVAFLGVLYGVITTASAQTISPVKDKNIFPIPSGQLLTEKPRLFSRLPEKFTVGKPILDKLFTAGSRHISADNQEFPFEGEVVERVQKNPNVISVNIRLSNYEGTILNVSRIINSDLSVSYIGRAVNVNSGDILLLKNENGKFYFTKENQSLTMVE